MSFEKTEKICPDCEKPHFAVFPTCDSCLDKRAAAVEVEVQKDEHDKRVQAWLAICPPAFRSTDWSDSSSYFDELSPIARQAAKTWWAGDKGKGLGLFGSTGKGKSRAMYDILKRHHFAGRVVKAVTALEIQKASQDVFSDDKRTKHEARRLLDSLRRVGLLYIDDIGKETMTARVGGEFHGLFDYRINNHLPTLWTTEKDGKTLANMFGEQYGDGLIRRFRQCSEIHCVNEKPVETDENQQPIL